jgi:hypothetical protein
VRVYVRRARHPFSIKLTTWRIDSGSRSPESITARSRICRAGGDAQLIGNGGNGVADNGTPLGDPGTGGSGGLSLGEAGGNDLK